MARARKNDANLRGQADPGRKASVASGMLGHDAGEILITRDAEIRVQCDHAGVSILVGVLGHCSSLAELNLGWNGLCPPLSPPSELEQGVAMSTSAVTPFRSFVQTSYSPSPLRAFESLADKVTNIIISRME